MHSSILEAIFWKTELKKNIALICFIEITSILAHAKAQLNQAVKPYPLIFLPCEQRLHFRGNSWRAKSSPCRQPFSFLSCMRKIRHASRKQLVRQICVSFAGIKLAKTTRELLSSSFCFVFLLCPLWF